MSKIREAIEQARKGGTMHGSARICAALSALADEVEVVGLLTRTLETLRREKALREQAKPAPEPEINPETQAQVFKKPEDLAKQVDVDTAERVLKQMKDVVESLQFAPPEGYPLFIDQIPPLLDEFVEALCIRPKKDA